MSGDHSAAAGTRAGRPAGVEAAPRGTATVREVKRRPKNRKAQIASSAVAAFSALGYHSVSMDDIASRLDISAAALYRHYPSKYALFREAVLRLGSLLQQSAMLPPELIDAEPDAQLDWILRSLISATIANRQSGALYRWQGRYLKGADQRELRTQIRSITAAVRDALARCRSDADPADLAILAGAALSVIGSIVDHHATLPAKQIEALLKSACRRVLDTELPPSGPRDAPAALLEDFPFSFKHELLLRKAVLLFHERGYPEVSIEEIAATVDLPASGVYRYFQSKSDILAAAFRRAAEKVSSAIGPAVADSDTPQDALRTLIAQYVAGTFEESELTFVYYAEIGNVPAAERMVLRNIQRLNVEEWAKLVVEARPALSPAEARFLVHAALGLVVDMGRHFRFDKSAAAQARVRALMHTTLMGN